MLEITNAPGRIKKLNARVEYEGEESRHAVDVSVEFQVVDTGLEVIQELGYPELREMFGENHRPSIAGLDFKLREKIHHIEVRLQHKGSKKHVDLECDVAGLTVTPIQCVGLNFKCKFQSRVTTDTFGSLWNMWCDGDVQVSLKAKQFAMNEA